MILAKDIYEYCKGRERLVIIGGPGSGKTPLAMELGDLLDYRVLHTDDFMEHGYVGALQKIQEKLDPSPVIVEGIQGVRVLRSGAISGLWMADVVVDLGNYGKMPGLATILGDYKKIMQNNYTTHPLYIKELNNKQKSWKKKLIVQV